MDFKKCNRCGSFYLTDDNICGNCQPKDSADIYKLKTFLEEEQGDYANLEELSINTGISLSNINRFAVTPEYNSYFNKPEGLEVDIENFGTEL